MKVFCQSTTPASDSCKAQTGDVGSEHKNRRSVAHNEERIRFMTSAGPEADVDDGGG